MEPAIKRPTLNHKTLLAGRATSSNPSMWRNTYDKSNPNKRRQVIPSLQYKHIQQENLVLETIGDQPGLTIEQLVSKLNINKDKICRILKTYKSDGVSVVAERNNRWYLT